MKKIIIENLSIQDLATIMYGDDEMLYEFTEKEVNEVLKSNAKVLQDIYDCIDDENYEAITPEQLYILGDTINMLNATKYKQPMAQKPLNYRQSLDKAIEHKINILMLEVANEIDCIFKGKEFSNKDFEIACALVEEAYLKSEDISINQIARALYKLIWEDSKPLADITRRALIDEACYM